MLLESLKKIPDQRRTQGQRYKLHDILFVSILSILSGADSYRDIARFANGHLKKLKKILDLGWKNAPSKSVLRDIFCGLDKLVLEKNFRDYSQNLSENWQEISNNEALAKFDICGELSQKHEIKK